MEDRELVMRILRRAREETEWKIESFPCSPAKPDQRIILAHLNAEIARRCEYTPYPTMAKNLPECLPICSATVKILGSHWPQTSTIWAGLRLNQAKMRGSDTDLYVPWCHVDDPRSLGDCIYRIGVKDDRYRFAKARNGSWVLRLADNT